MSNFLNETVEVFIIMDDLLSMVYYKFVLYRSIEVRLCRWLEQDINFTQNIKLSPTQDGKSLLLPFLIWNFLIIWNDAYSNRKALKSWLFISMPTLQINKLQYATCFNIR